MRVAFFMNRFPLASETFIMNTAVGLIDAGHHVDLYGLFGAGSTAARHGLIGQRDLLARSFPPRFTENSNTRRWLEAPAALLRTVRRSGIRAATSGLNMFIHQRRGLEMRALHEVDAFRKGGRYDVLHCHFGTLAEPILRHRRAGGLSGPVVVHFRGYDISSVVEKHGTDYYKRVFREADGFIANSVFFRDRAIALGCPAERITVVESPVNLDLFPFAPRTLQPGEPIRLLTVGRLVEKKGIEYAVEAVAQLRDRGYAIQHRIIGEGVERGTLERLISARGLTRQVSLLGERSQEDIACELGRAHIFIAPSVRSKDGAADVATNTVKEAMASGTPVVSTWHGGIPEVVEDGVSGLLVPERDAAALAACLETLIRAPEHWPQLGAAGRRVVETRFSFAFVTSRILNTYARAAFFYDRRAHTLGDQR